MAINSNLTYQLRFGIYKNLHNPGEARDMNQYLSWVNQQIRAFRIETGARSYHSCIDPNSHERWHRRFNNWLLNKYDPKREILKSRIGEAIHAV